VRGLCSGGTLCYEAQYVLEGLLGPVHSNEPLRAAHGLPAPDGAHVLLDLGAEEYTQGRAHPMIDPSGRLELLRATADDPAVAVVLLDVVLGHGSHEDPAGQLAPVCAELMAGGGPPVVAYLLGTEADPQGWSRQRAVLREAGCIVPETNARAAYAAAALVRRDPALAEAGSGGGPVQ
jgi:FdrA protein